MTISIQVFVDRAQIIIVQLLCMDLWQSAHGSLSPHVCEQHNEEFMMRGGEEGRTGKGKGVEGEGEKGEGERERGRERKNGIEEKRGSR